jgi:hypothetical protein
MTLNLMALNITTLSIVTISLLRSECFNEAYFAERRLCSVLCFRMSNRLQSLIDFVTWALSDPRAYQGMLLTVFYRAWCTFFH